jgi:hypothetical protein
MKKVFFLVCIIFFVACNQKRQRELSQEEITKMIMDSIVIMDVGVDSLSKIDLNPFLSNKSFDFGSLVKEIKLVSLESTEESIVDDIYKIIVTDSNIYIKDGFKGGGIVIFDRNGKFMKRISNGPGPGELVRLYDIAFDKENNELVAYQHSFLLFFSTTGEFLRQIRLPFGFYNFSVIPNGYVFKTLDEQGNGHLGFLGRYTFLVTDKNLILKMVGLPCLRAEVNYIGYNYLYNNNKEVMITKNFCDTVFQYNISNGKLEALFLLDYRKKKLPEEYVSTYKEQFFDIIKQNDYYYFIGEVLETQKQNVFFLRNDFKGLSTMIFRNKNSGNLKGGTNGDYEFAQIPHFGFPVATSKQYFISLHFPHKEDAICNSSMLSEEDKEKIQSMKEDDNPMLVFYELKDF